MLDDGYLAGARGRVVVPQGLRQVADVAIGRASRARDALGSALDAEAELLDVAGHAGATRSEVLPVRERQVADRAVRRAQRALGAALVALLAVGADAVIVIA